MGNRAFKWILVGTTVALLSVAIALYSCRDDTKITSSQLIGTYISNYRQANYKYNYKHRRELQNGVHYLELKENGTYIYRYRSFDGKESYTNSNVWKLEYLLEGKKPYIICSDFAFGALSADKDKRMDDMLPLEKTVWGTIIIWIDCDYGYYFEKEH